jgi:hypothetical protein
MTTDNTSGSGQIAKVPDVASANEQTGSSTAPPRSAPLDFWERVKKHKVVQWTVAYGAAAYTLLHIAEMVRDALDWPHILVRVVTLSLFLGAPVVATLAWYHGHRALHRVSGGELAILTVLLFIAAGVMWDLGRPAHNRSLSTAAPSTTAAPSRRPASTAGVSDKSIAVLPFSDMSEKHDQEYFADGMAEEILDVLAKVPDLQVTARTSSFQFKGRMKMSARSAPSCMRPMWWKAAFADQAIKSASLHSS